jgi:hypothetical protein
MRSVPEGVRKRGKVVRRTGNVVGTSEEQGNDQKRLEKREGDLGPTRNDRKILRERIREPLAQ